MRAQLANNKLDEKAIRELAEKRRQQLRSDLKHQIREKKAIDEQLERENEQIANTGLPIGLDYVNRFDRYKAAHQAALKEQVEEKARKAGQEKELDRQMQEQYTQEMRQFQEQEKARREEAEAAKREHYRQEMQRFMEEREAKKREAEYEKLKDQEVFEMNKARQREEDLRRQDAIRQREDAHLHALKDQMDSAVARKVGESDAESRRRGEKELQDSRVQGRDQVQVVRLL